jgi:hypothetical protein
MDDDLTSRPSRQRTVEMLKELSRTWFDLRLDDLSRVRKTLRQHWQDIIVNKDGSDKALSICMEVAELACVSTDCQKWKHLVSYREMGQPSHHLPPELWNLIISYLGKGEQKLHLRQLEQQDVVVRLYTEYNFR